MNYKLIFSIASSLLLARWKQTLVAAIGVTFSITMFIALLGFMNGLNDLLDGLIVNRTPDVRIYNDIKPGTSQPVNMIAENKKHYNFINSVKPNNNRQGIYNSISIIKAIKNDNRVWGIAPKITAPLFFNVGSFDINGMINGIDVQAESSFFHFEDYITSGNSADIKNVSNSIVLGKGLAGKLVANIGDVIQVTTAKGEIFPLKVVGYYQSGLLDFDNVQSFASIATTQKLLGESNDYLTDIQVKLKDMSLAPAVAKEYHQLFGVDAEDIQTANKQFETGSFVRSLISYAVGITLLIVAGFGIYNILNMMIYEKMDSIAILKATGFSVRDVNRIFLSIALSIGFFGGLLGLLLGFLLSLFIGQIPFNTPALPTVKTYPVNFNVIFYIIGFTFSILTTFFSGWFPAIKAGKVDPVTIIRGK